MKQKIITLILAIGLLFSCTDGNRKRVLFRHTANIAVTHDYSEGLALIMTDDGKYGYIDQKRQMAIPPEYDCAYDFHEGLAVVGITDNENNTTYQIITPDGRVAFGIGLDSCIIGTKYQDGLLWYLNMKTGHEGYLDRNGYPTTARPHVPMGYTEANLPQLSKEQEAATQSPSKKSKTIEEQDWHKVSAQNPFFKEAQKILSEQLAETDANNRRMILNYCEHLRTSYTTKDIDFLEQVFSDEALIIVGHVIKSTTTSEVATLPRVSYNVMSKHKYLQKLRKVFMMNKTIDVHFSDFSIKRHPTMEGIYGVTLRQQYHSDRYQDDGWLFLLWDFRDITSPMIHVRTWQAAYSDNHTLLPKDSVISIRDFNLK